MSGKMGKKRTMSQPKKAILKKSQHSKRQIHEESQKIIQALQQIRLDDGDPNDVEHSLLRARGKVQTSAFRSTIRKSHLLCNSTPEDFIGFSKEDQKSTSKHFLNISPNLSQPSCDKVHSLTEQCESNMNFIEAIVRLSSVITCASQLSTELPSTQDNCADDVARSNSREESLPESDANPVMDGELSFNLGLDISESETFDSSVERKMYGLKFNEAVESVVQTTPRNCLEELNGEAARNDSRNAFAASSRTPVERNDFADVDFCWEGPLFTQIDKNEQATTSTTKQSDEMNNSFQLNPFFNEDFITPTMITQPISPPKYLVTTLDNMSLIDIDMELDEIQDCYNVQTENCLQSPTCVLPVSVTVKSPMCSSTGIHNYRVDEMTTSPADECDNTRNHNNLRSFENRETTITSAGPSPMTQGRKISRIVNVVKQLSSKKRKRGRPRKWSTAVPDYNVTFLNKEYAVLEPLRVILTTLSDEKAAEEYMTRNCWKASLMEKAVNAVLAMSDVLTLDGKFDICREPIITTVTETLDKIITCARSDKAYASRICHVQVILQLCNSMPISVAIIDHLMTKLKSFSSMLSQKTEIRRYIHIDQLYVVFYALNIALRKYRTIVPHEKSRATENTIPHVANLWKMRYIDENLQHTKVNVNDTEKRWGIVLDDFAVATMEHFMLFAKKSRSLIHVLDSQ